MLRSVIYHKKQKYFLAIFCSVLQLVGVEITYEGVERNLGVKNRSGKQVFLDNVQTVFTPYYIDDFKEITEEILRHGWTREVSSEVFL